jgi:hypothetical protein
MKRFLMILAALALAGTAAAQTTVLTTTGTGADEFDVGRTAASVSQQVRLVVPPRVGLHLDVSQLDFDLRDINTDQMVCVYGTGPDNTDFLESDGWTLPRGLAYTLAGDFGTGVNIIEFDGGAAATEVTQYPPARFDDNGELIEGSKAGFVCFRTFIVQKFSNYPSGFDISVARSGGNFDMYVQDNSECSWNDFQGQPGGLGGNGVTGFFEVNDGASVDGLLPGVYSADTTGNLSNACGGNDKGGWHDDQMIVAIAIDGQQASGVDRATLTYTITGTVP